MIMNMKRIICMATVIACCASADQTVAQSFLRRLSDQLTQQLVPPPPDDTLPPPREPVPAVPGSRATLGIRVGPVTEEVIREQQLVVRQGAVITAIEQGSAADRAGLPIGAVIVA